MWFDMQADHTCTDCRYGNKDISNKICQRCMVEYCMSDNKYTMWEKLDSHSIPDRLRELSKTIELCVVDAVNKLQRRLVGKEVRG